MNASCFSLLWLYLGNSQVSIYRTIGPTLVFTFVTKFQENCRSWIILTFYQLTCCNLQGIESMNLDHEKWSDVNGISSLLKSFFQQLPEALVTGGKSIYLMLFY